MGCGSSSDNQVATPPAEEAAAPARKKVVEKDIFTEGNLVHLTSKVTEKNVRIQEDGEVNAMGGFGKAATFEVKRDGETVSFICVRDGKATLRINKDGQFDGKGQPGGKFTKFIPTKQNDGTHTFAHQVNPQHHMAVKEDGEPKPAEGSHEGKFARFTVVEFEEKENKPSKKEAKEEPAQLPKEFEEGNVIFLQCKQTEKNLRVLEDGSINGMGGKGKWAKFKVHRDGDAVQLRSVGNPENILRIRQGGLDASGKPNGKFTFFHVITHGNNVVTFESRFDKKQHVGIDAEGNPTDPEETGKGKNSRFIVTDAHGE